MPASKKPTIYDVAKHAGVSITTVSRMLNAPDKVNSKTRERVLAAIDKLGFVPKAEARARAMQHTGRIGVITPFFTAPSFIQRLRGIAETLSPKNYELVIYTVDSSNHLQGYLSSLPLTGNLDGLIILSLPVGDTEVRRLIGHGLPTVLIEYPHPKLNCVEIEDVEGGYMAATYLLGKGPSQNRFFGRYRSARVFHSSRKFTFKWISAGSKESPDQITGNICASRPLFPGTNPPGCQRTAQSV